MKIDPNALAGILILTPKRFEDERGVFSEVWNCKAVRAVH